MNLDDFLLERIAETEAAARYGHSINAESTTWPLERALADCAAKRSIVEQYRNACTRNRDTEWGSATRCGLYAAMLALAQPYAEHPDFPREWRAVTVINVDTNFRNVRA